MRKVAFIISLFLITSVCQGQVNIEKHYFKDLKLTRKTKADKAKYELVVTHLNDSISKKKLYNIKTKNAIWEKTFFYELPYGVWKFYNNDGTLKNEFNLDSIIFFSDNELPFSNSPKRVIVETSPVFKGGEHEMQMFLAKTIEYPKSAREQNIQGKVILELLIDAEGFIQNVSIVQSIHPLLDDEAVRVAWLMPQWIPAKRNGKPIACKYYITAKFVIQ